MGRGQRSWVRWGVAGLTWAAVGLLSPAAGAFCRSTTCKGDCPTDAEGCPSTGAPLYWNTSCVGFSLQRDGTSKLPADAVLKAMRGSFAAWSSIQCLSGEASLRFVEGPPVACAYSGYEQGGPNVNVIIFRDWDWGYKDTDNTLAKTTVTYDPDTGEIFDADIEVNTAFNEVTAWDDPVVYDLQSIMTHEIGHFVGLAHAASPRATMNASYDVGSVAQRSLDGDDEAAICAVYPPSRPVSCNPDPRGGQADSCGDPNEPDDSGCSVAAARSAGPAASLLGFLLAALLLGRRQTRA